MPCLNSTDYNLLPAILGIGVLKALQHRIKPFRQRRINASRRGPFSLNTRKRDAVVVRYWVAALGSQYVKAHPKTVRINRWLFKGLGRKFRRVASWHGILPFFLRPRRGGRRQGILAAVETATAGDQPAAFQPLSYLRQGRIQDARARFGAPGFSLIANQAVGGAVTL